MGLPSMGLRCVGLGSMGLRDVWGTECVPPHTCRAVGHPRGGDGEAVLPQMWCGAGMCGAGIYGAAVYGAGGSMGLGSMGQGALGLQSIGLQSIERAVLV